MSKRKKPAGNGHFWGTGYYTREIIKRLAQVAAVSGHNSASVYGDFASLAAVCLEALPEQLKAVARTGRFAPDSPETSELFNRLRVRYEAPHRPAAHREVWQSFAEAFALLLESAEPGLWGEGSYGRLDIGYLGPDVLGHIFLEIANTSPQWRGTFFTPWNAAMLMSQITVGHGERLIYDRLKAACLHPDNLLGQAVVMASLLIPEGETAQAREWFFNRLIPAALPWYQPVLVGDIAGVGSGVLLLAAAAAFPEWAVRLNLVTFVGAEIDEVLVKVARTNCQLYGLNGYSLRLAEAVSVAREARSPGVVTEAAPLKPNGVSLGQVLQACPPPTQSASAGLTFESLFRAASQAAFSGESGR